MPGTSEGDVHGTSEAPRRESRLDDAWRFHLGDTAGAERPAVDDAGWEAVTLPHTARIEALVTGIGGTDARGPAAFGDPQWQGTCWYRRALRLEPQETGRTVLLRFDGAMNVADVFLDGERVGGHLGGWLPFVLDLTGRLQPGREHLLAVRLDNRDNAITGPKPLAQLDYNPYHGLYRSVHLVVKDRLHITDAILADRPASGGVFVTFPRVAPEAATVRVQTHVRNTHAEARTFRVRVTLRAPDGMVAAEAASGSVTLEPGADRDVTQELDVPSPELWSPAAPHRYALECALVTDAGVTDAETVRVGIRRIAISREGFRINGERMFLRGANRHQEYPYIGYALSDEAQYRDARKIKDAGFDYVRLSHYAHAPAFMDACDELGLVVMDCIPGWQFFNPDPAFIELQLRNCRDLIRRDRNHPCVILWEVSLNESGMPPEFVARTHAIAHEEYPGDQCFTAGWMHGYDVFIDARQHGGCRRETGHDHACVVSEYGDWEYYAMNAGLDQGAWRDLTPAESNSRQLRWQGERAQLQQATNFQEAHNDNLATAAFADGLWVMFDYNRGYAPDIESSGCVDIFRLPKFSYWFFRSQRAASERRRDFESGPVVFIASWWTPESSPEVRVFSNCDEVALRLNGRLIGRQRPDQDRISARLAHPPFTFRLGAFTPGVLSATGYIGGRRVTSHTVRTPRAAERLVLTFDTSGRQPPAGRKDHLFCRASLRDVNGTLVPGFENVAFGATGGCRIVGMNPIATDAGVATALVETLPGAEAAAVHAVTLVADGSHTRVISAAAPLLGLTPRHVARRTATGAELVVNGDVVASLDAGAPKVRIPVSAPPDRRDPFRRE
jgi:beta-galactosidase